LTPISLSSSSTTLQCSEEKESTANKAEEWARGTGFWRCFAALCVPILLSAFEGSVVSTALPTISLALDLGPNSSWVATAFLLASIVFQPLFGQLADIWGRRHLMMIAVVIFGAGSAVAGYANNCAVLIFGRIIQGVGSGGIDLFAELILCDIIPLKKRGYYVAIKAAVYALGTTVGPLLGGVFAQTNWRWCFGVNLPICIIALVLMWFWLQLKTGDSGLSVLQQVGQVDYLGIVLLTTAVVLILCVLSLAGTVYSWSDPTIVVSLAGGFSGIVAFIFWQRSRRCAHPIMAPYVFSNRTTIAALAITAIHGFITYGFQFYLPPFFQAVLGASPSQSGVLILPCSLTIVVLAAIGGPLLARFGKYRLMHVVGFALLVVGLLPCITGSVALWIWILLSFLVGTGSGLIVSTTLPTVLVELTDKENAAATGSWAFLRGLGSLLGVAIPNAVFNAQFSATLLHNKIDDELARSELRDGQAYQHASASFISKFDKQTREEILGAFTASFKLVWIIFLSLAVVGLFATFLERQVRLRRDLDSDFGLKDPQRG
jgi:EmrB/QacA subfamily drug resistance transporter